MISLPLANTTFQELVEDALASIPALAPGWTDYNTSDPGIMLIELLAWTTEAQLYALGHVRQDERAAYAGLVGVRARGPQPARGLVWPQLSHGTPPPWGGGMQLPMQTPLQAERGNLPKVFLERTLWLHGATLASVVTLGRDGVRCDHTPVNLRRGGSFALFGTAPQRGDRLLLGLSRFPVPYTEPAAPALVAVGFRIRNPATGLAARTAASARFHATLTSGGTEHRVAIREDSTLGLAQTGVMLLECPVDALTSGLASVLSLELVAGELFPAPLAERIDLNVLSVVQQEQLHDPAFTMGAPWPDAQLPLLQSGVCFGDTEPPVSVSVSRGGAPAVSWTLVEATDHASPGDTVFTFDPVAGVVQFGNGINGAIPASGSQITVRYRTSEGKAANVGGGLSWSTSALGVYGSNLDPMAGGADDGDLDDLQARSRETLAQRPLITDADLLAGARALTGLRVVRAEVLPPAAAPGVRTLVVLRDRDPGAAPGVIPETALWLTAVRRALRARLTLGQRLRVIGPRYVPLTVKAAVSAAADADPAALAAQIAAALQARFALFAGAAGSAPPWPMGTAVALQSVRGWLRAVPGVLGVTALTLSAGGQPVTPSTLALPPTGLPQLAVSAADITVTRIATGSRR